MKHINYTFLFLALFAFQACKNSTADKQETASTSTNKKGNSAPVEGPVSINDIKAYVKGVDDQKDTLRQIGPSYFFKDKVKTQVILYSNGTEPLIVFCQSPDGDQFIYLSQRRPVFMRELVPVEDGFQENRFYYSEKDVLAAETRQGSNVKTVKTSPAKTLDPKGADDYRFKIDEINKLILKYLYNL